MHVHVCILSSTKYKPLHPIDLCLQCPDLCIVLCAGVCVFVCVCVCVCLYIWAVSDLYSFFYTMCCDVCIGLSNLLNPFVFSPFLSILKYVFLNPLYE